MIILLNITENIIFNDTLIYAHYSYSLIVCHVYVIKNEHSKKIIAEGTDFKF